MSLDAALSIASSGLWNINRQIAVISQNVANAGTPDYAREVATQTSVAAGGQGMGVNSGVVIRQIDLQLQHAVFSQNATVQGLQTRQTLLQPVDAAQGTPGQGTDLASALGNLQNSFTTLQADPSSSAAQGQVVTAASSLARQINTLSAAYGTARQNAQDDMVSSVGTLNAALATISDLNIKIVAGQQAGQSTADLENQRDSAMRTVSGLVDVTFVSQPNGAVMAATKGGLMLTLQNPPPQFSAASSSATQSAYYPGGGIAGITLNGVDVTQQLTGGQIGADLTLRDTTLPTYQGELDEFANTLNTRLSAQGLQLFTAPQAGATSVVPAPTQAGYVGYASSIAVNPLVSANPSLVRDGNVVVAGSATGASAFTPNPSGGPAGFTDLISRVLTYGFGSQAQSGVAQPSPATTGLGPLGTLTAPFAAPATLAGFASDLVSSQSADIGAVTSQIDTERSVQTALQTQLSAGSGVSVDTEMSNMVELQNAYGANARVISALQTMWNQLLQTVQ